MADRWDSRPEAVAGLRGVVVWCLAPAPFPSVVEGSSSLKTVPLSGQAVSTQRAGPGSTASLGWPPTWLLCEPSSVVASAVRTAGRRLR